MKFVKATIFGFGKWSNYSIDFTKDSFICIVGENESGKSTLQKFIQFMLFGYPPKKRKKYRSKTSGAMGGRLTVNDPEIGEFTIERIDEVHNGAAICMMENGERYDESWLKERMKGLTENIYRSIFSFTALDLHTINAMDDHDLTEILLGIGLTGSSEIYVTEKYLDKELGILFKKYGSKPEINQQIEKLNALEKKQEVLRKEEEVYQEQKHQMEKLKEEIIDIQAQLTEITQEKETVEKQLHVLPMLKEYQQVKNGLREDVDMRFPEKGLERIENLKNKFLSLQSELAMLNSTLSSHQTALEEKQEHLIEESIFQEIEAVWYRKNDILENEQQIISLQKQIERIDLQLDSLLRELNLDINKNNLEQYKISFQQEKQWNKLKHDTEHVLKEQQQYENEIEAVKRQRNSLLNDMFTLEAELLDEEEYQNLSAKLQEYHQQQSHQQDINVAINKWTNKRTHQWRRTKQILIGSILFGGILTVLAYWFSISFLYSIAGIVAIIGVGQWWMQRQWISETDNVLQTRTDGELDISIEELRSLEAKLKKYEARNEDLKAKQQQLDRVESDLIRLEEKLTQINKQLTHLKQEKEVICEAYPFLEAVAVEYWPDVFHKVQRIQHIDSDKRQLENQYSELLKHQEENVSELAQIMKQLGEVEQINNLQENEVNIRNGIKKLEKCVQEQNELKKLQRHFAQLIQEEMEKKQALQKSIHIYKTEINQLYQETGVDSEEAYYEKAIQVNRQKDLLDKHTLLTQQLSLYFQKADWQAYAKESFTEFMLESQRNQIIEKRDIKEKILADKQQELANLQAKIKQIEASETYSNSIHQFQMEKEKLYELTRKWAVLKIANEVLQETKREYRDKYLTDIIERTTVFFSRLTGEKYVKIIAPKEAEKFKVIDQKGTIFIVDELSKGTIDQLHISLKLAISQVMSEYFQLPIIIDDAFVHFDGERAKKMFDILRMISKQQQVLYFTCQEQSTTFLEEIHCMKIH
ncbi:AAA family ATPase [Ornithinibacillus sp. 4-3]|uniref:AAA family ATPase n=1 Tax=Ornithinibacillus sp. 4-3 TaxID=3231488 RepID=A0AB39HV13_9BACI